MGKKKDLIRKVAKSERAQLESNPQAHRKIMYKAGTKCKYCPPWKNDNKIARRPKRGANKPKHKDHR